MKIYIYTISCFLICYFIYIHSSYTINREAPVNQVNNILVENNSINDITGVSAYNDSITTNNFTAVSIDVLCNDFENNDDTTISNLILGDWKLQYIGGGFSGQIHEAPENVDDTYFTFSPDSIYGTGEEYFDKYNYEGSYYLVDSNIWYVDVILDSTSSLTGNAFVILEASDSSLVISEEICCDIFNLHLVPVDELHISFIDTGIYGIVSFDDIETGVITYIPTTSIENAIDTITYVACNNLGMCDTAYLIVTIDGNFNSINDPLLSNFKVYPNPANDIINIETNYSIIKSSFIYNSFGRLILRNKSSNEINISDLVPGIYFIKLEMEDGSTLEQSFVKQ